MSRRSSCPVCRSALAPASSSSRPIRSRCTPSSCCPAATTLSTAAVFREADRLRLARSGLELELRAGQLAEALVEGQRLPAHLVTNDLQEAALSLCPTIELALDAASAAGADHAIVSGSGPTVVGIWWGNGARERAQSAADGLRGQFPGAAVAEPVTVSVALPEAC